MRARSPWPRRTTARRSGLSPTRSMAAREGVGVVLRHYVELRFVVVADRRDPAAVGVVVQIDVDVAHVPSPWCRETGRGAPRAPQEGAPAPPRSGAAALRRRGCYPGTPIVLPRWTLIPSRPWALRPRAASLQGLGSVRGDFGRISPHGEWFAGRTWAPPPWVRRRLAGKGRGEAPANEHAGGTPAYPGALAIGEKPHRAPASARLREGCRVNGITVRSRRDHPFHPPPGAAPAGRRRRPPVPATRHGRSGAQGPHGVDPGR